MQKKIREKYSGSADCAEGLSACTLHVCSLAFNFRPIAYSENQISKPNQAELNDGGHILRKQDEA